jgi:ABC-type amino acid transport substrate-binding protein
MPAYYSKPRAKAFTFSDSFAESPVVLAAEKGSGITYKNLRDLIPYRIGVVRGFVNGERFDNAEYLNKVVAESNLANFKKLLRNEIDLLAIDKLVAINLLKNNPTLEAELDDIEFIYPPVGVKKIYVMFSNDIENKDKLKNGFNQGLSRIKEQGVLDQIKAKYGLN